MIVNVSSYWGVPFLDRNTTFHTEMSELSSKIEQAKQAYQDGKPIMTDEEYDALSEGLTKFHGVRPKNSVSLPYYLGSLDKVKYGKNSNKLQQFAGRILIQDKLDGVSALYIHPKLYTRGDGYNGRDISHLLPSLNLPVVDYPVRGELILSKDDFDPKFGNDARSTVAGIINSGAKSDDRYTHILGKIHFVAYAVMGGTDSIMKQYQKLKPFRRPWAKIVEVISDDYLLRALKARREKSPYVVDGIVLAKIGEYSYPEGSNPKHMLAFKQDSSVPTTVTKVEWSIKKDGQLFPKVYFEPVSDFGATMTCASGKNAKWIVESGIGPGARIMVTRANDVIPDITSVIIPVEPEPELPDVKGHWDGPRYIADNPWEFKEYAVERLLHFVKTLKIENVSKMRLGKLYDDGVTTTEKLMNLESDVLGEKITANLKENIERAKANATEAEFMAASGFFPGLGVKKLADVDKMGPKTRAVYDAHIDEYTAWRKLF